MERDPLILNPRVEKYLLSQVTPRPSVVLEMEDLAAAREFPIVGPLVGHFLKTQALTLGAERVLELGSGFGYSALWFAQGLRPGGEVVATESSAENAGMGKAFLSRLGLSEVVRFEIGNALDIADHLRGQFDIVFNDIDKRDYPRSLQVADQLLRPGGVFISDNMLWYGKVLEPDGDDSTEGVRELTRLLITSKNYQTTILPLRDGLSLSLKLR